MPGHAPRGRMPRFLLAVLLLAAGAAAAAERPAALPDQLLVGLRGEISAARVQAIVAQAGARLVRRFELVPVLQLSVPEPALASARSYLERLPEVEYVEPNARRYAEAVPNDSQYPSLWNLHNSGQTGGTPGADVQAEDAWSLSTGSRDVVVAVIDSGLDLTHPDLAQNLWTNPGEIPGNGKDDEGNGFVDDVNGWDLADDDADPGDSDAACSGHGTHVAGTIGAVGNNGAGIVGVNWAVRILPVRAFKRYLAFCSSTSADVVAAIQYAAKLGVRVSNNSYGGGSFSRTEARAIAASRMIFVTAAGNESADNDLVPSYPACYNLPNVVSVAATDARDQKASFSNFGVKTVDLAAPGVRILSTLPGNGYGAMDGTSMAAPHVTGAVALQMAANPGLTNNEVQWRVLQGVDERSLPVTTGGRLNLYGMLSWPAPSVTAAVAPAGATSVARGGTARWKVTLSNAGAEAASATLTVAVVAPGGRGEQVATERLSVPAGGSVVREYAQAVPVAAALGEYPIAASAEVAGVSFDEDVEVYTVTR